MYVAKTHTIDIIHGTGLETCHVRALLTYKNTKFYAGGIELFYPAE